MYKRQLLGGLIGAVAFGIGSAIVFPGGSQWARFLYYGILFCAPLVGGFIATRIRKKSVIALAIIVLVIISLPTFFMQSRSISTTVVYDYERSLGSFISYGTSQQIIQVTVDPATCGILQYYIPNAQFSTSNTVSLSNMKLLVDTAPDGFIVLTKKSQADFTFYFGENATEQYLINVKDSVFQNERVYDSGFAEIYFK